jgi:hypothetical protein
LDKQDILIMVADIIHPVTADIIPEDMAQATAAGTTSIGEHITLTEGTKGIRKLHLMQPLTLTNQANCLYLMPDGSKYMALNISLSLKIKWSIKQY